VSGRVTYNGYDMDEFLPQRTSAYIGPGNTGLLCKVSRSRNTLRYAIWSIGREVDYSSPFAKLFLRYSKITDMLTELSRREKEANIKPDPDDVYMKVKCHSI
jgi:hypothetical protein